MGCYGFACLSHTPSMEIMRTIIQSKPHFKIFIKKKITGKVLIKHKNYLWRNLFSYSTIQTVKSFLLSMLNVNGFPRLKIWNLVFGRFCLIIGWYGLMPGVVRIEKKWHFWAIVQLLWNKRDSKSCLHMLHVCNHRGVTTTWQTAMSLYSLQTGSTWRYIIIMAACVDRIYKSSSIRLLSDVFLQN